MPVVKRDDWSNSLKELNLPIIQVSDWEVDELNSISQSKLYSPFNPQKLRPLWMPYWHDLIRSKLKN